MTAVNFSPRALTQKVDLGLLVGGGSVPRRLATHEDAQLAQEVLTLVSPVWDLSPRGALTWTPFSLSVQVASVCRSCMSRQVAATSAGVR